MNNEGETPTHEELDALIDAEFKKCPDRPIGEPGEVLETEVLDQASRVLFCAKVLLWRDSPSAMMRPPGDVLTSVVETDAAYIRFLPEREQTRPIQKVVLCPTKSDRHFHILLGTE